jgi:hypothetical protein
MTIGCATLVFGVPINVSEDAVIYMDDKKVPKDVKRDVKKLKKLMKLVKKNTKKFGKECFNLFRIPHDMSERDELPGAFFGLELCVVDIGECNDELCKLLQKGNCIPGGDVAKLIESNLSDCGIEYHLKPTLYAIPDDCGCCS